MPAIVPALASTHSSTAPGLPVDPRHRRAAWRLRARQMLQRGFDHLRQLVEGRRDLVVRHAGIPQQQALVGRPRGVREIARQRPRRQALGTRCHADAEVVGARRQVDHHVQPGFMRGGGPVRAQARGDGLAHVVLLLRRRLERLLQVLVRRDLVPAAIGETQGKVAQHPHEGRHVLGEVLGRCVGIRGQAHGVGDASHEGQRLHRGLVDRSDRIVQEEAAEEQREREDALRHDGRERRAEDVAAHLEQRLGHVDIPARSEAWSNYVDALHSDEVISDWQVSNWEHPDCCNG